MGCHTWYKIPTAVGKENIIQYLKDELENYKKQRWWDDECEAEWQYLLSKGGFEALNFDYDFEPNLKEIQDELSYSIHSTHLILKVGGEYKLFDTCSEFNSDEPRISGYPNRIVTSYEDMVDFIKTGFDGERHGKPYHYDFYCDESRYDHVMDRIKQFFIKHPDGIIRFG